MCLNCNKTFQTAVPNWNFSVLLSDMSEATWLSVLGDQGDLIMGMQACDFNEFKDDHERVRSMLSELANTKEVSLLVRAKVKRSYGDADAS
mmetsp:Transcript_3605/g.2354  ORF Transcript_3605/g.2354 Transcript_3605/m.2354 type:complete len:91 (+) Transcript_3605:1036-1308(+)